MSELRELYQSVILDHNKKPRNFGEPEGANHHAHGDNPLCGDKIAVHVCVKDDVVQDVGFVGQGCAISTASASLMTEAIRGKTLPEVEQLFGTVHDMLTRRDAPVPAELGKLAALSGVREFPARVKCASLCWHTLNAALAGDSAPVKTE
jgi:nitrogen fixation protein NifU and related proteins